LSKKNFTQSIEMSNEASFAVLASFAALPETVQECDATKAL
jgi:hypothetical protein